MGARARGVGGRTRILALTMLTMSLAACGAPDVSARPVSPDISALCEQAGAVPAPGSTGAESAALPTPPVPPAEARPSFPLGVDEGRRILVDAAGQPFRIQGDAGWSMIAGLQREDVDLYLTSRAASRFNTILVNLIEHEFIADPPANAYGVQPFTTPGDFSTPNEEYFAYADEVIQRAEDLGFVLLLTPAYIGYAETAQGWYGEMQAAGVDVLYDYGRYVGERLGHHQNIIWVNAGDADPDQPELIDAVARGIRDTDPDALQTAHGAPGTPAAVYWGDYDWLDVNNVYSYSDPYGSTVGQYADDARPLFLLESTYENEFEATHAVDAQPGLPDPARRSNRPGVRQQPHVALRHRGAARVRRHMAGGPVESGNGRHAAPRRAVRHGAMVVVGPRRVWEVPAERHRRGALGPDGRGSHRRWSIGRRL